MKTYMQIQIRYLQFISNKLQVPFNTALLKYSRRYRKLYEYKHGGIL